VADQLRPGERRFRPDGDGKAKPAWLRMRCGLRQDKEFIERFEAIEQYLKVSLPKCDGSRLLVVTAPPSPIVIWWAG
jgi:hypothetical protein